MPLSKNQIRDICYLGGGSSQCLYLYQDGGNWQCAKRVYHGLVLLQDVIDYLQQCQASIIDPTQMPRAIGDNCRGLPITRFMEVGKK